MVSIETRKRKKRNNKGKKDKGKEGGIVRSWQGYYRVVTVERLDQCSSGRRVRLGTTRRSFWKKKISVDYLFCHCL